MDAKKLAEIKKLVKGLGEKSLGVYLYGSYAEGNEHARSDIDVCVVAGEKVGELYSETNILMGKHPNIDAKLFEELPLHMKKTVIGEGILLYCKNQPELTEYLRFYKKLWNGQAAVRLGYAKPLA